MSPTVVPAFLSAARVAWFRPACSVAASRARTVRCSPCRPRVMRRPIGQRPKLIHATLHHHTRRNARLARPTLSPRSDLGRRRGELRSVLRERDRRRALPVQPPGGRHRVAQDPASRAHRPGVALLSARRAARAVLRLSRPRPVRSEQRTSLQSREAPHRSVRESDHRHDHVEQRTLRVQGRRTARRSRARSGQQRRRRAEVRRDRSRRSPGKTISRSAFRGIARSSTNAT